MKASEIQSFNSRHVGEALVLTSGSSSHFMCSDSILTVFEQLLSPALEKQRSRWDSCQTCQRNEKHNIAYLQQVNLPEHEDTQRLC